MGIAVGTSVGGLDHGEQFHWELLRGNPESTRADLLFNYPLYTSADALSIAFRFKGPKVVISNACAAGSNSIGFAADAIREGRADVMIAGGVDVLDILSLAGFDSLNALDSEPCAPYSPQHRPQPRRGRGLPGARIGVVRPQARRRHPQLLPGLRPHQ